MRRDDAPARATWLPVSAAIAAVLSAAFVILPSAALGSFSAHMAGHIAAMNVVAPLAAIGVALATGRRARSDVFWGAAALQIATLWAWHLPALQQFSGHGVGGALLMHGSLFSVALLFWSSLLCLPGKYRWHGVLGLLVTGKLSCLLAAVLVFAPRSLYPIGHSIGHSLGHSFGHSAQAIDDQQLAGLLMITACPLSYLVAGIVLTSQLVAEPAARGNAHARSI